MFQHENGSLAHAQKLENVLGKVCLLGQSFMSIVKVIMEGLVEFVLSTGFTRHTHTNKKQPSRSFLQRSCSEKFHAWQSTFLVRTF